ncbi:MAG TPA: hypothetical protein VMF69_03780 [Gemmataceae bacterium]|nr:hypothetical protein [Gemmataceae bacterium]
MGLDFTALIRYGGPAEDALQAIALLKGGEEDPALAEVIACGLRNDFAFAKNHAEKASWRSLHNWEERLPERPCLPSLEASLQLPSDFSLTFGGDTVWVYHSLRWIFFVTENEWQRVMLEAVKRFCGLFAATDCIITNDQHPAVAAFRQGAAFRDALAQAARQGEGEVARISDLFIDKGCSEDLVFKDLDGTYSAVPLWDTHGYRRLPFSD